MHLRGCAQNHRIHIFQRQTLVQIGGDVGNAVFVSHFLGLGQLAANQRHHLDTVDEFDAVQMLDAKCACACQGDFDGLVHEFSKIK